MTALPTQAQRSWPIPRRIENAAITVLREAPKPIPNGPRPFACLHVDDAHALHAEWAQRGAIVLHSPIDRDWGMREFAITTPDGHRLMVGEILPS